MLTRQTKAMTYWLKQLLIRENGQDLVEYVLLFTLIVMAVVIGMTALGGRLLALYNDVSGAF